MSTYLIAAGTLLCVAAAFSQIPPDPRHLEEIVYDSKRDKIVLYGGGGTVIGKGLVFPDHVSEWKQSGWKDAQFTVPGTRVGHSLVYNTHEKATFLIAGITEAQAASKVNLNVWKWDGKQWQLSNADAPMKTSEAAYDPISKRILVYGDVHNKTQLRQGSDPQIFELWELKANQWKQLSTTGPATNSQYEIAFDMARNALVIPFWENGKSVVWEWKNEKWNKITATGDAPSARNRYALAYHPEEKATFLFGGRNASNPFLNDLWKWGGQSWTKIETPLAPAIRAAATMEYGKGALYLYGGVVEWGLTNEIWRWTKGKWNLLNPDYAMDAARTAETLKKWTAEHPEDGDAHGQYGRLLILQKHFAEAELVLKKTVELKPRDHNYFFSLLEVLYKLDKAAEAESYLREVIASGSLESYTRLGNLLFSIHKYAQATRCLEKAVQLRPNAGNYYNLACAYALSGNQDQAFDALNKAIENGFKGKAQFEGDSDLDSLKADARWKVLLQKLQ